MNMGLPDPTPLVAFGYGTAAMTYGIYLAFRFPKAKNEEEEVRIKRALIANGFAFGGIAQFVGGLLAFTLHPGSLVGALTAAIFGMLWTAIWLNEYFNADSRPLTFLDIGIAVYTFVAGFWFVHLGMKVFAFLMWSITVLVLLLTQVHGWNRLHRATGVMALENWVVAYYLCFAIVTNAVIGTNLPL